MGINNRKRNCAVSWYTQLQPEQEKVSVLPWCLCVFIRLSMNIELNK